MEDKILKVTIKSVCRYKGHSIKQNGSVDLNLTCDYSELSNSVQLTQLLNNDIDVRIKAPDEKPLKLGTFRLKSLKIDDDGCSNITLNGLADYIETNNLNELIDLELFVARFDSEVEIEEGEE